MSPLVELGENCIWRSTRTTRSWLANSRLLRWVTPLQFQIYSIKLTRRLRPSCEMVIRWRSNISSRLGQASERQDCRASSQDGRMLQRGSLPARPAHSRHQRARQNRLAEEERLRSSRPRRTRYSALQAHHRMRDESACAGATKD